MRLAPLEPPRPISIAGNAFSSRIQSSRSLRASLESRGVLSRGLDPQLCSPPVSDFATSCVASTNWGLAPRHPERLFAQE